MLALNVEVNSDFFVNFPASSHAPVKNAFNEVLSGNNGLTRRVSYQRQLPLLPLNIRSPLSFLIFLLLVVIAAAKRKAITSKT